MEAKDIVAKEVARQAEFGCEPSWEDFVVAGKQAGKAECAKTHFKPDWIIKAQDIKDATEEGFKAGEDQGYGDGYITGVNDATRKAVVSCNEALVTGSKEVVEWLNTQCVSELEPHYTWWVSKEKWQAKLKEWGIEWS